MISKYVSSTCVLQLGLLACNPVIWGTLSMCISDGHELTRLGKRVMFLSILTRTQDCLCLERPKRASARQNRNKNFV